MGFKRTVATEETKAAKPQTDDEIIDALLASKNNLGFRLIKALALALNDGLFVPGSDYTGTQLKAIIKARL